MGMLIRLFLLVVASFVFFFASHAFSKTPPNCESSNGLSVSESGPFNTNYKRLGSVKLWGGASPDACQVELVDGGMTELEQLQRLMEIYYVSSVRKPLSGKELIRSCKLFVDDDVEFDVRAKIDEMPFRHVPALILYVVRLDGGSLFYLECFEGSEVVLMPAEPSNL